MTRIKKDEHDITSSISSFCGTGIDLIHDAKIDGVEKP